MTWNRLTPLGWTAAMVLVAALCALIILAGIRAKRGPDGPPSAPTGLRIVPGSGGK